MTIEELKKKYGDTKVLVIEDKIFNKPFDTFTKLEEPNPYEQLINHIGKFIFRYDAELDPTYRQVIPYCLVKFNDNYFVTQRIQGDSRLVGKSSLGTGGHIEPIDCSDNIIREALMRELNEELDIKANITSIKLEGLIYSSNTEVDKVHIGLVYIVNVDSQNVSVKETDTLKGMWVSLQDLFNFPYELESWSQICLNNLLKGS